MKKHLSLILVVGGCVFVSGIFNGGAGGFHLGGSIAGILACIEPITATLIGVLILHEPCSLLQWPGIV